jgi:radical SAM-linked protein
MQIMNIRLKFTKGKEVKYISHLDLMRVFQRAIRRTGIPISYSSGFNPHQEISFGAPLPLGITSNAEYVDFRLVEPMEIQEIKNRLNSSLPEGIRILEGIRLGENPKSAMSAVTHARYQISMEIENIAPDALEKSIEAFISQEHIIVMKEQPKKGFQLKEVDIRPMIVDMKLSVSKGGMYNIDCLLLSGSRANLNP